MGVSETVRAAGGVVWRRTAHGDVEILLVHREGRDDWTLPKGKVERGETEEVCAVREVREETNLRCALGPEVGVVRYRDQRGRRKTVRYWSMDANGGMAAPQHEVDAVRWVPLAAATRALSYARDRDLVNLFARQALVLTAAESRAR